MNNFSGRPNQDKKYAISERYEDFLEERIIEIISNGGEVPKEYMNAISTTALQEVIKTGVEEFNFDRNHIYVLEPYIKLANQKTIFWIQNNKQIQNRLAKTIMHKSFFEYYWQELPPVYSILLHPETTNHIMTTLITRCIRRHEEIKKIYLKIVEHNTLQNILKEEIVRAIKKIWGDIVLIKYFKLLTADSVYELSRLQDIQVHIIKLITHNLYKSHEIPENYLELLSPETINFARYSTFIIQMIESNNFDKLRYMFSLNIFQGFDNDLWYRILNSSEVGKQVFAELQAINSTVKMNPHTNCLGCFQLFIILKKP